MFGGSAGGARTGHPGDGEVVGGATEILFGRSFEVSCRPEFSLGYGEGVGVERLGSQVVLECLGILADLLGQVDDSPVQVVGQDCAGSDVRYLAHAAGEGDPDPLAVR